VVSFVIWIFLASPRSSRVAFSRLRPTSSEITWPRGIGFGRQRLQREDFLALARARRNPVGDRRPEQAVHRRLLGRIEGEIRVLDVARDEPAALERAADPFGNPLHQLPELTGARAGAGTNRPSPEQR
jgi:hypothetical protein